MGRSADGEHGHHGDRADDPQAQLLTMNPQIHDVGEAVYIGNVINLDWTKTG